nr:hypothetical protein [Tanacetum cinerariifolium]
MSLTFAKTHNVIAYLTKSDACEGFNQIIDFLNGSSIKYALTVNPNIYVLCIKQFWTSVAVKKVNDVTRLQALVDKKKIVITKATIRDALYLDDAEGIECLPNEEIFAKLARMGRKFNFTKYIFDSLVRNVDSSTKFYMYPHFLQLMIRTQVGDLSLHTIKYSSPALTQKVDEGNADMNVEDVSSVGVVAERVVSATDDFIPTTIEEPSILSPTPPTPPPQPSQDIPSTSQGRMIADMDADVDVILEEAKEVDVEKSADVDESADVQGRKAESQAQIYQIDLEHDNKVLSMQDDEVEPVELQEVVEVVTTAKLITKVVIAASATITVAATQLTTATAPTLTTTPSAVRRRKGVVIRDSEESATPSIIIHTETISKDKEAELNKNIDWDEVIDHVQRKQKEDNDVKRYQALKRKPQSEAQARKNMMIYLRNVAGFKMDYFKGMIYVDIRPIFEKRFNSNVAFLLKTKEKIDEEDSRALKKLSKTKEDKAAKKKKLDEEVEEEASYDSVE